MYSELDSDALLKLGISHLVRHQDIPEELMKELKERGIAEIFEEATDSDSTEEG